MWINESGAGILGYIGKDIYFNYMYVWRFYTWRLIATPRDWLKIGIYMNLKDDFFSSDSVA